MKIPDFRGIAVSGCHLIAINMVVRWLPVLIAVATPLYSSTGSLVGTVAGPSNTSIASAVVLVTNQETRAVRKAETNESGAYTIPGLPPGSYQITVSAPGFQTAAQTEIQLRVGDALRIDIVLTLAAQTASIDVSEQLQILETDNATRGQVIGRREITDLPLNLRNFLSLALLAPGVTPPAYGSFSAKAGGAIHVNGGREQSNQFLLEGVDNADPRLNQVSLAPPVEAIDQFKVQSSNSSSDFGRMAAGQVDMVLKSGANSVHGSLFEFLRNRHLDARNFFDLPPCRPDSLPSGCADKPAFDRNQFGASIGGPLIRDRTFYFVTYEGLRRRQAVTRQSTVPSINDRNAVLQSVPASQRHPAGMAILALYPLANVRPNDTSSRTFVASPLARDSVDQMVAKLDHRLKDSMALSGHYGLYDQRRVEPFESATVYSSLPGFSTVAPKRSQHTAVGFTHTPNVRTVMQTRFGAHFLDSALTQQSEGNDLNSKLGFPRIATNPSHFGYPSIAVVGFTPLGEGVSAPGVAKSEVFNMVHNTSLQPDLHGARHLLQFGGAFRYSSQFRSAPLYARGLWSFNGSAGLTPLQQLVRGLPTSALAGRGDSAVDLSASSWSAYVSDSVRLGRSLTLQAGIRYEFNRPATNAGTPLTVPDFRPESAACTPKPDCQFVPGAALGLPDSTFRSDWNNFAPRIGLSWRPNGTKWLVVRSAYGINYDGGSMALLNSYSFNPPFSTLQSYQNPGVATIESILQQQAVSSPAMVYRVDPSLQDGYVQQWNLGLQFALRENIVLETAYVGSKGSLLTGATNPNQAPEGGGPRPFPQFGAVASAESRASSNYHSMQVRLERRYRAGSSLLAAYTWGRSTDDASLYLGLAQAESYVPQNSRDRRSERALSIFDTKHRLVVSFLQELPSLRTAHSLVRGLWGRWQFGAIATFNSGHPFPILRQINQSGTVPGPLGDLSDRPDVVSDPTKAGPVPNHPDPACRVTVSQGGRAADQVGDPSSWFNPCAFAAPSTLRFGNSARNNVLGPGVAMIDVSVSKRFGVAEGHTLQIRFDAFNLANRPHFDLPQHYFDSASFSAVSSSNLLGTTPPRQIQIGLRYQF